MEAVMVVSGAAYGLAAVARQLAGQTGRERLAKTSEAQVPVEYRSGYGSSSSSYGGGASLETALLSLAFLAFAVFVIQNLQAIIALLTGGGGGGRSATGRATRPSSDADDSRLYDLDMVSEVTHQFMLALYKYSGY
ncbi:uncharacterized protein LOC119091218 [Pollicipes pollicipes]|uniref:uncharacterized protein LOC119091218 n=1 Tax=Pollicipes pollicipes TaxID=41117 RepID=UPI0018857A72|nr:uncharacterized protein LOC119091218 [Pollicipes pollicipes]